MKRPSRQQNWTPILTSPHHDRLLESISGRTARVGVIGLGYVGLPLAVAVA
ncbi:nucleotide sugar dehydrogenase, partial [Sinorhizobium meliloti]